MPRNPLSPIEKAAWKDAGADQRRNASPIEQAVEKDAGVDKKANISKRKGR